MAKNTKSTTTRPRKRGHQQKERVHSGPPSRRSRAMSLRVPVELLEALCHVAEPLGEATMKHFPNAGPLKYYGRKQGSARSRGFNQLFKQFTLEAIESQIQQRVHVALLALHTDAVSRDHKAHIRQHVVFDAITNVSAAVASLMSEAKRQAVAVPMVPFAATMPLCPTAMRPFSYTAPPLPGR